MRKQYIEPEIIKIELNLAENIATSSEETVDVPGFKMRQMKGTPGGCREFYVKTKYEVINESTLMEIYFGGCIQAGSNEEQRVLRMM